MKLHKKVNYHWQLPTLGHHDVMVCGGGPSVIPDVLAAQRAGVSVLFAWPPKSPMTEARSNPHLKSSETCHSRNRPYFFP
jgi:hypothetical protein